MTPTIEQNQQPKKTIFSAIQPSGTITLGNYLGALQNWIKLQDDYNCIFALADLHTITVRQDPATFRKNTIEAYALLLACGIDPEKSPFFIQNGMPNSAAGRCCPPIVRIFLRYYTAKR